jgi:hypothetical protein
LAKSETARNGSRRTGKEAALLVGSPAPHAHDDGRGQAMLTTITAAGASQTVVHRWPENQSGQKIQLLPIDWAVWRAEVD